MILQCFFQGDDCGGPIRWHHPVLQQRLKRKFKYGAWREQGADVWLPRWQASTAPDDVETLSLSDILGDTRNRVFLCDTHHERLHNHRFYLELPESVYAFADDFGFRAQLENDARRAA